MKAQENISMVEESSVIAERVEALEDELNVLKNEIKQNLMDLREFIMRERTIFPEGVLDPPRAMRVEERRTENNGDSLVRGGTSRAPIQRVDLVFPESGSVETPEARQQVNLAMPKGGNAHPADTQVVNQPMTQQGTYSVDATMMSNIIWWLGTVKQRGLTLQQISPFLEAYEMSGHLGPAMAKLIIRSMADLATPDQVRHNDSFAAQEFADCLLQLNNIICTPGYIVDRGLPPNPSEALVPPATSRGTAPGVSAVELPELKQKPPSPVETENGGSPT